ncbi:MAG TPA: PAS domain-containing protein, partial [Syntrophorhabdaceae bacterium]|nr:PAS domain-containing protein [Syntrophorhabdaceae bacterium]
MRDEEKTKEELISELKALRASAWEDKERWRFAIEGGVDGIWEWNVQTREVFYSRTIKDMFGYEEDEIGTQLDEWMKRIHPDDVKAVMEHIDKFLKG